jgi:hypothetical protein
MTTVYWTPVTTQTKGEELSEVEILFGEPKPLTKAIATTYAGYMFIQCPATQAFYRNTFVVTAPMSGVIQVGEKLLEVQEGIRLQCRLLAAQMSFRCSWLLVIVASCPSLIREGVVAARPSAIRGCNSSSRRELVPADGRQEQGGAGRDLNSILGAARSEAQQLWS